MNIMVETGGRNHTDDVHRHNLSVLLTAVHRSGGLPRARLTQLSGLNRSTVAALVAELVDAGLAIEAEPDERERAGRPSRYVRPSARVCSIAVNPEIDAIRLGVVALGGRIVAREERAISGLPSAESVVATITEMISALDLGGKLVVGIGAAIPGLIRHEDGVVRLAPHFGWIDEPFSGPLAEATGLPVFSANDASVGANAERLLGAGVNARNVVYLNGGASGIGGGVIVEGSPLSGASGYAGELGHTLVNSAGRRCHCGAIGCLETEVSQAKLMQVLGLTDPTGLGAALAANHGVTEGIGAVLDEIERQRSFLSVALRTIVNVFNPELIVFGGFLGDLYDHDPERLLTLTVGQSLDPPAEAVSMTRAALGTDTLLLGAAELAFASLLADPIPRGSVASRRTL